MSLQWVWWNNKVLGYWGWSLLLISEWVNMMMFEAGLTRRGEREGVNMLITGAGFCVGQHFLGLHGVGDSAGDQ